MCLYRLFSDTALYGHYDKCARLDKNAAPNEMPTPTTTTIKTSHWKTNESVMEISPQGIEQIIAR